AAARGAGHPLRRRSERTLAARRVLAIDRRRRARSASRAIRSPPAFRGSRRPAASRRSLDGRRADSTQCRGASLPRRPENARPARRSSRPSPWGDGFRSHALASSYAAHTIVVNKQKRQGYYAPAPCKNEADLGRRFFLQLAQQLCALFLRQAFDVRHLLALRALRLRRGDVGLRLRGVGGAVI